MLFNYISPRELIQCHKLFNVSQYLPHHQTPKASQRRGPGKPHPRPFVFCPPRDITSSTDGGGGTLTTNSFSIRTTKNHRVHRETGEASPPTPPHSAPPDTTRHHNEKLTPQHPTPFYTTPTDLAREGCWNHHHPHRLRESQKPSASIGESRKS